MLRDGILAAALALASLTLAGCDDTVHVFQPEQKPLPQVIAEHRADPGVITVSPIRGLPDPLSRQLADAMAEALGKDSLPVVVGGGNGARVLYSVSGSFERQAPAGAGGANPGAGYPPTLTWEVRDEEGRLVGRHSQILARESDPFEPDARAKLLADVEGAPARMMAKGIEGDAPIPKNDPAAPVVPDPGSRSLVITRIQGSPGRSGDAQLRQAIEYALKVANVHLAPERSPGSLALTCVVKVEEVPGGIQHIKVTWSVLKPDGKELGQVSQENNVPSRILERVWGEITAAVAQNAAGGIAAIVGEADQAKAGG
ncbi:MAG TPA: hypothetical protein VI113_10335 [Alphaproteobacteria bacterium]